MRYRNSPLIQLTFVIIIQEDQQAGLLHLNFQHRAKPPLTEEYFKTSEPQQGEYLNALPKEVFIDLKRYSVEKSLQLDRNLVLVTSMKLTHLNFQNVVLVQAGVESISRYHTHRWSRKI